MSTNSEALQGFRIETILRSQDAVLALALIFIIGMMIVPLPPILMDLLVVLNLAISLGILLISMYIGSPMDFYVFPTALLLVTLLRLGINISASRLILLSGNAGKVISTFGDMVVGGNYVVGVVVFLMLMIIQFVVITNGAGRVAEVAARFTLDAMPGKQLSIDADLNAGLIDEEEARRRRAAIEAEADFYGAMDGASKFVRGDAIAAVAIVLVNIFGGFIIGMIQRNLTAMEALQTYTLLTVGSGLVVQIPAVLISTAAGLIVTRSASETSLGSDMAGQLSNVGALFAVAAIMFALSLVPGLPKLPFVLVGSGMSGLSYAVWRTSARAKEAPAPTPASEEPESPEDMMRLLVVDPLQLEIGYGLIPLVSEDRVDNLLHRVTGLRRRFVNELGLVLPMVRIRDNLRLPPNGYRINIRGEEVARGELLLDHYLAIPGSGTDETIPGIPTTEPAFGLPATWITEAEKGRAELLEYTVVDPLSVLSTHLAEVIRDHAPELLGRQELQEMIDRIKISLSDVHAVLRNLLRERVPIRDLAKILEVLATNGPVTQDPNILCEAARQSLARTISNQYRDENGVIHAITLAPDLESKLKECLVAEEGTLRFQMDPGLAQSILNNTGAQMERLARSKHMPVLLCGREIRLAFRRFTERALPNLAVLAFSEISPGTQVKGYGIVENPMTMLADPRGATT